MTTESQGSRIESGVVQFGDDWPGLFLRGDNAMAYAMSLQHLLEVYARQAAGPGHELELAVVRGLVDDLLGVDTRKDPPRVRLRPAAECLPASSARPITPEELSDANKRMNELTRQLEECKRIAFDAFDLIHQATQQVEVPPGPRRESMTHERFVEATMQTRLLVERTAHERGSQPEGWRPERYEQDPTAWRHLTWMLNSCTYFHQEGKVQKANRWLGFVQGVLALCGVKLEELKRANMPEGEAFDARKL